MNKWIIVLVVVLVLMLAFPLRTAAAEAVGLAPLDIQDDTERLPRNGSYERRPLSKITTILVHHSLTDTGTAAGYARYHIDKNGWPGIAYHFVIDPDGTIHQTNALEAKSWHGNDSNGFSIGVCLTGNFDNYPVRPAQAAALKKLISYLNTKLGKQLAVEPHSKYNSGKSCPGRQFNLQQFKS